MKEFKRFIKVYLKSFSFVYVFCSLVLILIANDLMSRWGIVSTCRCVIVLLVLFAQSFMFIGLLKIDNAISQLRFEENIKKIKEKLENEENMEFNEQNKF
jgi:hypothetical protein